MKNNLLKHLNNEIIKWENLYGYFYTTLYDENGHQRKENINENNLYDALNVCNTVMNVLNKIKRNRFNDIKKSEKRKYKIK
jgi:hypothetical protein